MNISYARPEIHSILPRHKHHLYEGLNYPLKDIDHRDFEKLIYSLYNQEIKAGNTFDDIALMSGVKENGQDCALFLNSIKTGIIQCKHSDNNNQLSISSYVQEIIKFILYSFVNNDLLPNINNFTYLLASSSGYSTKVNDYLRTFNSSIATENKLKNWTNIVQSRTKSIAHLLYSDIEQNLKTTLSKLKVQLIIPADIELLLNKHSNVVSSFFIIRSVADNSIIDTTLSEVKKLTASHEINIEKVINDFKAASSSLANYKNTFSTKKPIPIERKVLKEIKDWVYAPLKEKEDGIAILKGSAGSGKSVVFSNLYTFFINAQIPVIAIKADEKSAESIVDLERKLNLSYPFEESIGCLSENYSKVIVIIDQIDALSQTLSANRAFLDTYICLIEKLKRINNVRIIISVREYDLSYDPLLIPLNKHVFFNAALLTEDEVKNVLRLLCVVEYDSKLIKLLSTPLHLELFCKVYNSRDTTKFHSLYDLYNALWKQKIESKKTKEVRKNLCKTLFRISVNIYERGSLSFNPVAFGLEEIDYLKTEGLLLETPTKDLIFFHQTFYDYIYARQFVENENDVISYIIENNQGLHIRSCLKIILTHLREHAPGQYKKLLTELLSSKKVMFHIKQLTMTYLGFIEEPTPIEKTIVETKIINSKHEEIFFESINTAQWVAYFLEMGWLEKYLIENNEDKTNVVFQLLLRNIGSSAGAIFDFLLGVQNNEWNDYFIYRILFCSNAWNDNAIKLFCRVKQIRSKDNHLYCHCLENAIAFNELWVFKEFEDYLLDKVSELDQSNYSFKIDHSEIELLKKLFIANEKNAYQLSCNVIQQIVKKTSSVSERCELINDSAFGFFSRNNIVYHHDNILGIFISKTEELSKNKSTVFNEFIEQHAQSDYVTILQVVIFGYIANPSSYISQIMITLKHIYTKNGFTSHDRLEFFIKKLITSCYSSLLPAQKEILNSLIIGLSCEWESVYVKLIDNKKRLRNNVGYHKYSFLSAIPIVELNQFQNLRKAYHELNRRFGIIHEEEPNQFALKRVPAPYQEQHYKKMSLEDWEKTFLKYGNSWKQDVFLENVSIDEHGRKFEEIVALRPDFFLPMIEDIVHDINIKEIYKNHALNGLIKANYDIEKINKIVLVQIQNNLSGFDALSLIWNIKYLVRNNKLDSEVVDFLCKQALNNNDEIRDDANNLIQSSINSVRGAAIDVLMKLPGKAFEKEIFSIVESAIDSEKSVSVRATIAANSAYLIHLNKNKAFGIFMKVVVTDERLIKDGMWSAHYFATDYFSQMGIVFNTALKQKNTYKSLGKIFAKAWLLDIPESERYLFDLLKKSTEAICSAIGVAVHTENLILSDATLNTKCVQLFNHSLNRNNDDLVHKYTGLFLHFKPEIFERLFPILLSYSKSKVFKLSPACFCKYINKSCNKQTVHKCVELISQFDKFGKTHISQSNHYGEEPINTVLAIYNTLGTTSNDNMLKKHCMSMFDKMLQQPQHRDAANKVTLLADF